MIPSPETHFGYKRIDASNWLTPDLPILFPQLTDDIWIPELLKPQLAEAVPSEIRSLFECARAMYIYGYLFYPMITMAAQQTYRVVEAAAKAKCDALGLPELKPPNPRKPNRKPGHYTFKDNIQRLLDAKAISPSDESWWDTIRKLRNNASHPSHQSIAAPGMMFGQLLKAATQISELFAPKQTLMRMLSDLQKETQAPRKERPLEPPS